MNKPPRSRKRLGAAMWGAEYAVRVLWPWGKAPKTLRGFPTPEQLATTREQIKAESDAALALTK